MIHTAKASAALAALSHDPTLSRSYHNGTNNSGTLHPLQIQAVIDILHDVKQTRIELNGPYTRTDLKFVDFLI